MNRIGPEPGERLTSVRRRAGTGRAPGSALIAVAAWLLVLIGGGALFVSFSAQYSYVLAVRRQDAASVIEALLVDLLMIVFTLLALGLSRAGEPSCTKKSVLLGLYRAHPDYGDRRTASRVAAELAPQAGLEPGTARTYLYAELDSRPS